MSWPALAGDAKSHKVVAVELSPDDVGDLSALPDMLDQIKGSVGSVTADGTYDSEAIYDEILHHHPEADVIIPSRSTAVASGTRGTQRDEHLRMIAKHGRIGWQRRSGYRRRSLVETVMFCYKTVIVRRLHARTLSSQKIKAKIG